MIADALSGFSNLLCDFTSKLLIKKRRREASFDLLYVDNIDKFELGNS